MVWTCDRETKLTGGICAACVWYCASSKVKREGADVFRNLTDRVFDMHPSRSSKWTYATKTEEVAQQRVVNSEQWKSNGGQGQ